MRYFILLLLFFFLIHDATCQKVNPSSLLSDALSDERIQLDTKLLQKMESYDDKLPILEKIDARTEFDRLLTSRQEFMLRTSFNSLRQRKAEYQKHQSSLQLYSTKAITRTNEILAKRVENILDWVETKEQMDFQEKYNNYLLEKEALIRNILAAGEAIDLEDLISIKEQILENQLKSNTLELKRKNNCESLKINEGTIINLDQWPSVSQILSIVNNIASDIEKHPDIIELDAEYRYLNMDLQTEKAKSQKIVDFAQAKFTVRDDLLLRNRFSIGMGFTIPWTGSYRIKKQENLIKQEDVTNKSAIRKIEIQTEFETLKSEINSEAQSYQLWQNLSSDSTLIMLKNKIVNSGRMDPIKILELKKSTLDIETKILEHQQAIYRLYIKLLEVSGKLVERPYRNYLDWQLPLIENN
ncbi:MAG TPA: hypothetical protein PKC06_08870 [Saprospiraceae bacterium]|nr:hypothetical protein [Saprospiraceae bacterium]